MLETSTDVEYRASIWHGDVGFTMALPVTVMEALDYGALHDALTDAVVSALRDALDERRICYSLGGMDIAVDD